MINFQPLRVFLILKIVPSSDKDNINTNLDTPDPVSCASPLYSSIVSVQSTVANSASVSSPAKRLPLASVTNLLPGDTPK